MKVIPVVNKSRLLLKSRTSNARVLYWPSSVANKKFLDNNNYNEYNRRYYSSLHARNRFLLQPVVKSTVHSRYFGFAAFRVIRGLLKLRYLLLGGAITGGGALLKTFKEWEDALPDTSFIKDLLPSPEKINALTAYLADSAQRLKLSVPEYSSEIKEWLNNRLDEAIKAAEEEKQSAVSLGGTDVVLEITPRLSMSAMAQSQANADEERKKKEKLQQKYEDIIANYQKKLEDYQKKTDGMEREIKDLRRTLQSYGDVAALKKIKKSLIEMYREVLDELCDYDNAFGTLDRLPRVVVVGDQSSGKTSVLEMLVEARIFPRGGGQMMTRAPVMVTLMEGPYHIAQFKDSAREYDLTQESELADLRREVEMRMRKSVRSGRTISHEVISMSVKGPGLKRMVLVDLPGIIGTVTTELADDTKDAIRSISEQYMSNPNAIILCIQDGGIDAERSNVTDLVSQMDPLGKRTIFVLTKVDLAEKTLANPDRIKKMLAGKLFKLKALGYFAVVTGKGEENESIQSIKEYEQHFFKNSFIFKHSKVNPNQCTTKNLSSAVSEKFWEMIKHSVEQQASFFKAKRFNLETEWKHTFPRTRELDRNELFEKAKGEILDDVVDLSEVSTKQWEDILFEELWERMNPFIFDYIYMPAREIDTSEGFNTEVDFRLKEWTEELAEKSVDVGWLILKERFRQFMRSQSKKRDPILDKLKDSVFEEVINRHEWEPKASEVLRVIQLNAIEDRSVHNKQQWMDACTLIEDTVKRKLSLIESEINEKLGPSFYERWLYWRSTTEDQKKAIALTEEMEKILSRKFDHKRTLPSDEITTIKKNLLNAGLDIDDSFIRKFWNTLYRRHFYRRTLDKVYDCKKVYQAYRQGIDKQIGIDCSDIVLFWRIQQMFNVTSNALRQQIINREVQRLENEIKQVLEEFSVDMDKKQQLLTGRRVTLAEELKRVRQIQLKLDAFINAINKE